MNALLHFHFLRPWWLLVALPALLAVLIRVFAQRKSEQWHGVIAPHLLKHLVTQPRKHLWFSPEMVLLPFALVMAVAMAGPAYRLADTPEGPNDTTLLVAVDLSSSMNGQDIGPSRIARVRLKLRDLINLRRGERIGLIAVASSAHVVMPPTDDGDALVPYIDVLDPALMPGDGENFAAAAPLLRSLVQAEKGPVVLLVAADSIPPEGARALAELGTRGVQLVAWAVGTQAGIPGAGLPGIDSSGFDALDRAGASVVELSLGTNDVREIDNILDLARTAAANPKDASLWIDSGYGLVFVVAIGALFWFRRGWVIGRVSLVLLAVMLTGCGGSKGSDSFWLDLWLTPDQQGRRLFEQGHYKLAASRFEDPMWKGIAYYTAHDWQHAEEQFARVDTVEGRFNLANAYAQHREIASAIAQYDRALSLQPTFRAARKNRDYLKGVLAGLEQTKDFEELSKLPSQPADATKTKLRPDQAEGPGDPADGAENQQQEKDSLSGRENDQWMKQVATNPADFLRAKFAIQDQAEQKNRGATP